MKKVMATIVILALFIVVGMLFFTTPTLVGPAGVLVFFTSLYVVFCGALWCLQWLFKKMAGEGEMNERDYLLGAAWGTAPVLMMLSSSFKMGVVVSGVVTLLIVIMLVILIKKWE